MKRAPAWRCGWVIALAIGLAACGTRPTPAPEPAAEVPAPRLVAAPEPVGAPSAEPVLDPLPRIGLLEREEVRAWVDATALRLVVPREEIARIVADAQIVPSVQRLILPTPTPAKPRTWIGYRARFLDPVRINGGLAFWAQHEAALDRASARYGVPPEIIVAIAGVETVYGRLQGNYRIIDALATLGFAWPAEAPRDRSAYFREQLAQFIALSWERDLDPLALRGSYAGAIGIPQFMPGSIRQFAVDFDEDTRIDLHDDPIDAIGSIANFLAEHGWRADLPVALHAHVREGGDYAPYIAHDLKPRNTRAELGDAGVACAGEDGIARGLAGAAPSSAPAPATTADDAASTAPANATSSPAEAVDLRVGLVDLESPDAPTQYRCATANFFAITQYNRSFFYAAAVMDLAATLRQIRTQGVPTKPRKRRR